MVLNLAGARASKDPKIYDATCRALKTAFHLAMVDEEMRKRGWPRIVDEAVDRLIAALNLKDKAKIAGMKKDDLSVMHLTMGAYIREQFGLGQGNEDLMGFCCLFAGEEHLHEETASMVIIEALWERLRETYGLRAL